MEVAVSKPKLRSRRRELGSYYTPRFIVRRMLSDCLPSLIADDEFHILDPSCGDGAFLLEAFEMLREHFEEADFDLAIVRNHLFGVDVDHAAVESLRERFLNRLAPRRSQLSEVQEVLQNNFRCGDALTGIDFSSAKPGAEKGLNWQKAFPQVARARGFDLVIGNPPYRRERDARELFEQVAETEFGKRWRQARMDYWYYFLHRGLDLLKPNGRLSFIVNSYWTASSGAEKLIERLERETTFEEIVQLGAAPVFPDVCGRHQIFRLRKDREDKPCHVIEISRREGDLETAFSEPSVRAGYTVPRQSLFQHNRLSFSRPDSVLSQIKTNTTLGTLFDVRQGMAENPPAISKSHIREFGEQFKLGEGVFVLTADEVEALHLSKTERTLLRPYYKAKQVQRFSLPCEPEQSVLYLTKQTAPMLESFPRIKKHLERFRPILDRRRETEKGTIPWWCLHWPRAERIFTEPRVLCAQMGAVPQFVQIDRPACVGFSVNLILQNSSDTFSLKTLTGILNSSLAYRWFSQNAKQRGINLEINGGHLKRFPLPARDPELEQQIESLVIKRQQDMSDSPEQEQLLDQLVYQLYGVEKPD